MNLKEEFSQISTGKKDLRSFGITFGILFLLLEGFHFWRHGNVVVAYLFAAGVFPALSYFFPSGLRPIYKAWMFFALCLGWVMTRVILTVLFYSVLMPVALVARLAGKRFLDHTFRDGRGSFWIAKTKHTFAAADYERQF